MSGDKLPRWKEERERGRERKGVGWREKKMEKCGGKGDGSVISTRI